jgi:hypothetical protein
VAALSTVMFATAEVLLRTVVEFTVIPLPKLATETPLTKLLLEAEIRTFNV